MLLVTGGNPASGSRVPGAGLGERGGGMVKGEHRRLRWATEVVDWSGCGTPAKGGIVAAKLAQ